MPKGKAPALAPTQGRAGRGCWRGPSATGAAPTQLSLSVTLPVTVPLASASPPAPRYGADSGALGPRGVRVWVRMGRVGGTEPWGALWGLGVGWGFTPISCSVLAASVVPTHGLVPRPRRPGEGLVPGADGPQRQGSRLRLAGPFPALLSPASTQCLGGMAPVGVPGWAAPPRGCRGTRPCPRALAYGLWVPTVGCGHPAPPFSLPRACRTAWLTCCSPSRETPLTWWPALMPWASSWVSGDAG